MLPAALLCSLTRRLGAIPYITKVKLSSVVPTDFVAPKDFGSDFKLPDYDKSMDYLESENAHRLDRHMKFDSESHRYYFNNQRLPLSVTELVASSFSKFDTNSTINAMMSGKNWPRTEYSYPDGTPFSIDKIRKMWALLGEEARNRGTWMHYNIERSLNNAEGVVNPRDLPELQQFMQFKNDTLIAENIVPYRTEWRIAAPDLGLGGSVDFVGRFSNGTYILMDWKRSKNLPISMKKSYGKFAKPPLRHLPDCDGSKYSLQLNLYRYILSHYYDINVSSMMLASFHPQLETYFVARIPVMDKEVQLIISGLKSKLR